MADQTALLNDALGQIGAATVTAIDDGSTNANYCLTFYPTLRDALLRSHHWNFAMTRVELALDVAPPLFEFTYAYTLPPDLLKLVDYAGSNSTSLYVTNQDWRYQYRPNYKIEGRKLYSNDGRALIRYLRRVINTNEWDALFYQGTAQSLAAKLALAIRKDAKQAMALQEMAQQTLAVAMAVDGQEDPIQPFVTDNLLWGR